jgi:complement component 1 Q subcomponent-binding protein
MAAGTSAFKFLGSCGVRSSAVACRRNFATEAKGDQQLAEFLTDEIATEKKVQKLSAVPATIGKFSLTLDEGRVVLKGNYKDEVVKIELNVNHSVETAMPETTGKQDASAPPEMLSKPNFDVEIKKDKTTITFSCSFAADDFSPDQPQDEEGFADLFTIDEVCMFEGEWREETYAVSGDILDEYLYDLLMNMLEERGISNEFVEKLQEFCTGYEHNLYIKFLENLKKFASTS